MSTMTTRERTRRKVAGLTGSEAALLGAADQVIYDLGKAGTALTQKPRDPQRLLKLNEALQSALGYLDAVKRQGAHE